MNTESVQDTAYSPQAATASASMSSDSSDNRGRVNTDVKGPKRRGEDAGAEQSFPYCNQDRVSGKSCGIPVV